MAATELKLEPLAMKEAVEFWRNKVQLSPREFSKLSDEAKVMAFGVSGIAKGSELETVYQALTKAVEKGTTLAEFKRDCADIFEKRGWVGKRAWRVDNIFRTNLQTAYNVGRYKKQKEQVKYFPYLRYSAVNDSRTRKTHLALDGLIYPLEHSFWDTWYPPNGFRCRCGTRSLTKGQVERQGLKIEEHDPTNSLIEPIDPTTGNRLPAVQLIPDPGFAHHPGKTAWGGIVDDSLKKWAGSYRSIPNLRKASDYRRPALANVRPASIPDLPVASMLPPGLDDADYIQAFMEKYGAEKVLTDVLGDAVLLSLRAFQADKSAPVGTSLKTSKPGHGEIIPLVEEMILEPFEIWLTPQRNDAGKVRLAKRYLSLWKTADKKRVAGMAIFEVVNGVFGGVTAFAPLKRSGVPDIEYVERQREGLLLYGNK